MKSLDEVLSEVEGSVDDMVDTMIGMIRHPALAPVNGGVGEGAKADYLMTRLVGFDSVERVDVPDETDPSVMRPNILARKRGAREGTLWIVAHMDVVPAGDPEMWDTPPFEPVLRDGRIYGRGTEDNGQSVISAMFASRPFLDQELTGMSLGIAYVADEETTSRMGICHLLDLGVFTDKDVIMVPDWGSGDGRQIEVAEKSMLWLRFVIEGKTTHGSTPFLGINAYRVSTLLLTDLMYGLPERYPDRDEHFLGVTSTFEPTQRPATVENVNTIPGHDEFCMDMRLIPTVDLDDVVGYCRGTAERYAESTGAKITVEVIERHDAGRPSSTDTPGFVALADSIESVIGVRPEGIGVGGGTCANFFRQKGLDAYVWQIGGGTLHAPNENVPVENLVIDSKVYATLIHRLCLRRSVVEEAVDHPFGVELDDVAVLLAVAHERDGLVDGVSDREGRSALGVGVYLGEDDRVDPDGLIEDPGLLDRVVAGEGVADEDLQVGLGDPDDLLHLLDEVVVRLHPAGGVDEDDVLPLGAGVLDGVVGDRGRVRVVVLLDDLASEPVGVDGELLDGAGPERGARRHDDGPPVLHHAVRDLRDGGGLAGPVDPDEHDDGGPLLLGEPSVEVELVYLQDVPHGVLDRHLDDLLQGVGAVVLLPDEVLADPRLDLLDHGVGHVGLEQDDLQLVEDPP